jgi:hypothetical protein
MQRTTHTLQLARLVLGLLACTIAMSIGSRGMAEDSKPARQPVWGLEVGFGLGGERESPYIDRLKVFGFDGDDKRPGLQLHAAFDRRFLRYFALGVDYARIETFSFERDAEASSAKLVPGSYAWDTSALSLYLRAGYPIAPELYPFVQLAGGAAWATTELHIEGASRSKQAQHGPQGSVAIGIHVTSPHVGVAVCAGYLVASFLENRIGDAHSSGGGFVQLSLRLQSMEGDL